ncbi:hypothetical protein DID88_003494 [Monilinia fructigena]|uniref:Uncharacterized protein n=1 Tax=Monilinia fructigena TaxID=38457 RepID=A0A395IUN6_9HELO|nr:hypothetical protein DID88_003494 [Monilinia fructigena]
MESTSSDGKGGKKNTSGTPLRGELYPDGLQGVRWISTTLEDLNAAYYRDDETGTHMVGWELRVLAVRLQGMGLGDARRGVMGYYDLARDARSTLTKLKKRKVAGEEVDAEIRLWEGRLADLGIRVASALIEMEDLVGAGMHLKSLKETLMLQGECLKKGNGKEFLATEIDGTIRALAFFAEGRTSEFTLLYLGRGDEAKTILESLIAEDNSFHTLTFNLSTIYELCTERPRTLKIALAEKVAKMVDIGENEGVVRGWEKVNGDFKL